MRDGGPQLWPGVAAVGEEAVQRRVGVAVSLDKAGRSITVLDVGGVAGRVGRDVTLATLDLFGGIIATQPAAFGGFDRLTVDDTCGRFSLAAIRDPCAGHQHRIDRVEHTAVARPVGKGTARR